MTQEERTDLAEITAKAGELDAQGRQMVLTYISGLEAGMEIKEKHEDASKD